MPPEPRTRTSERDSSAVEVLANLIAELLRDESDRLCFLFGSGMVVPIVPGVSEVVRHARAWISQDPPGPVDDAVSPELLSPLPTGPRDYGLALERILLRYKPEGQQAFLQRLALQAYEGSDSEDLRRSLESRHKPLTSKEFGALEDRLDDWNVPAGLTAFADVFAAHSGLFPTIFTTNFDPLIRIALRRASVDARAVVAAYDTNLDDERLNSSVVTVLHLHGDCYEGATLHTQSELDRRRPQVEQWLTDRLRASNLVVVGYSGWDDIVRRALTATIGPAGKLYVMWAVREASEAMLEDAHPHLSDFLRAARPQAMPYHGVDRDVLFGRLRDSVRPVKDTSHGRNNPYATAIATLVDRFGFGRSAGDQDHKPTVLFWPHRLRETHLIHGVHAVSAAILAKAGVQVELHLDDTGLADADADQLAGEFEAAVRGWYSYVEADLPRVMRFSETLQAATESDRKAALWDIAKQLDDTDASLRDLLAAAKLVDPATFDNRPAVAAASIAEALDGPIRGRLLRPVFTFYVLRQVLARNDLEGEERQVLTLGGSDEQSLWSLWHWLHPRATAHLFVPRLDWVPGNSLWGVRSMQRNTPYGERDLEAFLRAVPSSASGDDEALMDWIVRCCVTLPRYARTGELADVRVGQMVLRSFDDLSVPTPAEAIAQSPVEIARGLAKQIGEWFYADA